MSVPEIAVRIAVNSDVDAIAALHAESWRAHYRGAYSDEFLDGEALADRLTTWSRRLAECDQRRFTLVAEVDAALAGFAYVILDEDVSLGAVLQNIHVATHQQRKGVGERLFNEARRTVLKRRPDSGLHVWVREQNTSAVALYEALGGTPAAAKLGGPFADGSYAPVRCFVWPRSDVVAADSE